MDSVLVSWHDSHVVTEYGISFIYSGQGLDIMAILIHERQPLFLLGHHYLSGMWFDVAPRTITKQTCVLKGIGLHAQNMISILDSSS